MCHMLSKSLMCLKVKRGLAPIIAETRYFQFRVLFSVYDSRLFCLSDCSYCVLSATIVVLGMAWSPGGKRRLGLLALWVKWLGDPPPSTRE